ncbi:MAG: hypothetical protein FD134_2320 [Gallionellaceae bacterium]|nr:MAG: hypothetical protein FD134_2320 [Gallionellaceae bacterium]
MLRLLKVSVWAIALVAAHASAATTATVYKSPTCGCCDKYVEYLEKNGFTVKAINEDDMDTIKKRYGTARAASCHTMLVDGYVVEGHVPVRAIRKMLSEKPAIAGISAPGMPQNSPGMGEEVPGTLTIYAIPKGNAKLTVFSVE